ncbi:MAG TPA: RNA polymerase sigma factor [Polyangiaceae bacterium]|nr:RNA polymerase sigma factor [Polyangiaceae bacterium]
MSDQARDPLEALSNEARRTWHGFLSVYEPLRPELYRYCRYLTRSPWDAEDLAQDALAQAFATLGRMGHAPPNPRAWLFRVASNLWIDRVRRERSQLTPERAPEPSVASPDVQGTREAAGTLVAQLAPQERAAVVLKDVFELTLEEIAEALSTTVGAVKAAVHRGRSKLEEPERDTTKRAVPEVITAFCAAFNAQDIPRMTELLLDHAAIEVVSATVESPADGNVLRGMLFGSSRMARAAELGGMEARFVAGVHATPARMEVASCRGEPLLLSWYAHDDGDAVRGVTRLEVTDGRISVLRNYFFTPDFIEEVCRELGLPFRSNGYRWWLPTR